MLCVLGFLASLQPCMTATPLFKYPKDTSQQAKDEMGLALKDAMTLARLVAITMTPCEEV